MFRFTRLFLGYASVEELGRAFDAYKIENKNHSAIVAV